MMLHIRREDKALPHFGICYAKGFSEDCPVPWYTCYRRCLRTAGYRKAQAPPWPKIIIENMPMCLASLLSFF
ncbi:hypothetical protein AKJ16_DCAP00978 [Drosera capensis]